MKLKTEDTSKPFSFLEGILNLLQQDNDYDRFDIKYNNKNFNHLVKTGKIKFHTLQHRFSFITNNQAKAKLIGQLYRMERTVETKENLILAISEFTEIALKLKYKISEMLTAIKQLINKDESWFPIYLHFKSVWKNK